MKGQQHWDGGGKVKPEPGEPEYRGPLVLKQGSQEPEPQSQSNDWCSHLKRIRLLEQFRGRIQEPRYPEGEDRVWNFLEN